MIYSYISGRLGNQLFQYAYVRFLLFKRGNKEELQFNFSLVRAAGEAKDGFDDSLKFFQLLPYKEQNKDIVLYDGSFLQMLVYLLFKIDQRIFKMFESQKWFNLFRKFGILFYHYSDNNITFNIPTEKNVFCYGKYENPKYFNEIRSIILKEFTPCMPPL